MVTRTSERSANAERIRVIDAEAPPERLAALRIVVAGFVTAYLVIRAPVFLALRDRRESALDPIGVIHWLGAPWPDALVVALVVVVMLAGGAVTVGWRHRVSGPVFGVGLLLLTSYRSSWGQLLHFEHLMVLMVGVLAFAPASDAWSVDARRRESRDVPPPSRPATSYGWPIALCALIVVITYVITGIAKLRYGGVGWLDGDTLRNHIAYSAARLDVLGGTPAPFAELTVRSSWLLTPAAIATVVVELGAPIALLGGRWRTAWCLAAWFLHLGILATMLIGFPVPLFGVAFAPFFRLEIGAAWLRTPLVTVTSRWPRRAGAGP